MNTNNERIYFEYTFISGLYTKITNNDVLSFNISRIDNSDYIGIDSRINRIYGINQNDIYYYDNINGYNIITFENKELRSYWIGTWIGVAVLLLLCCLCCLCCVCLRNKKLGKSSKYSHTSNDTKDVIDHEW